MDSSRSLPHSEEIEKAVLSCWVQDPSLMDGLESRGFQLHWFYVPGNRIIAKCMTQRHVRGDSVDIVTLTQSLKEVRPPGSSMTMLERCGGPGYITELVDYCPSPSMAAQYLDKLSDLWLRRRVLEVIDDGEVRVRDSSQPILDTITIVGSALDEATRRQGNQDERHDKGAVLRRTVKWIQGQRMDKTKQGVIPSPWVKYNKMVGGFFPGELIYLAARASVGKSSIAAQVLDANIKSGVPTDFYSLEMTEEQVCGRVLALRSGLPFSKMRQGGGSEHDLVKMMSSLDSIMTQGQFSVYDNVRFVEQMFPMMRKAADRGVKMVIIDYMQLIKAKKNMKDFERLSMISNALKSLCNETKLCVMALAQLNRDLEKTVKKYGEGRRPRMSDIRGCGDLEQDADVVALVHRPSKLATGEGLEIEDDAEIIIDKHRNGPTFIISQQWRGATMSFHEQND